MANSLILPGDVKPLIFGICGTELTIAEKELFQANPVFGFILFSRNIVSSKQLLLLVKELKSLYDSHDVKIFVDQEGGRVARIKPPIIEKLYPTGEHIASKYLDIIKESNENVALKFVYDNYFSLMQELRQFDIDSPLAPICDLRFPNTHLAIGDRSFGNNPEIVIKLSKQAIKAITDAGGIPCIKHIPGHGRAELDSHLDLPCIDTDLEILENTDFRIFKDLAKSVSLGMTNHIIYKNLDPELPVTLSSRAIDYIRQNIGFKGILVTDDICMYALHGEVGRKLSNLKKNTSDEEFSLKKEQFKTDFIASLVKVTKMSLDAGCDLVIHCSGDIDEMKSICQNFK
ncbi:MAG: glycoside hydrolase family 3 protein [Rickettsiaceae bacterium]|nr:glycoside hydrolase family 3 protein [Rickettsiaceae bacterium]